jgi:hypothetical protein
MRAVMQQMRHEPATLDQLAGWSLLGRYRVKRLLNALYLQSGLVISRSPSVWRHGGATSASP